MILPYNEINLHFSLPVNKHRVSDLFESGWNYDDIDVYINADAYRYSRDNLTDIMYHISVDKIYDIQMTLEYHKKVSEIFIDPNNIIDLETLTWMSNDGIKKFNQFMNTVREICDEKYCFTRTVKEYNVSLFELAKHLNSVDEITPLHGFYIENIHPDEIISINYNIVKENNLCDKLTKFEKSNFKYTKL